MKSLSFQLFLAFLLGLSVFGVPEKVEEAFREKYPDIVAPAWELDTNGSWEAHFEKNGVKYRSDFNANGNWIETENSLNFEELPANVRAAIEIKYAVENIRDIEAVESAIYGIYYDVEFFKSGEKFDIMYNRKGKILDPTVPSTEKGFLNYWMGAASEDSALLRTGWTLVYKTLFNLLTIFLFAYVIYYRRHHDHKMLFLLLAFNLFLFPIFLSSSLVTAGFGFTIFALLALVRLRSEAFDKAEIAYLLGAISLTFVNTMMPTFIDILSASSILLTALVADRPTVWRDSFQKIEVDYRITDKGLMLDQEYLRKKLAEEYQVDVREITINRVFKNDVRLTLMYRDLPELRKGERPVVEKKQEEKVEPFHY